MIGLGTLINVAGIVAGGLLGLLFGHFLHERLQETLMRTLGFCTIFLGVVGVAEKMLVVDNGQISTRGSMMFVISLALGALIGEVLNIEDMFTRFGEFLKAKTGNSGDRTFTDGFVLASLTVAIGAMAVIGSINDGLFGDYSVLAIKSVLDLIIVMIMTSIMGKGCIFAAIPVGILEGGMTLLARFIAPLLTEGAMTNLSMVGSALICLVGVNLVWPKTIRVSNLLPSIFIAMLLAFIM